MNEFRCQKCGTVFEVSNAASITCPGCGTNYIILNQKSETEIFSNAKMTIEEKMYQKAYSYKNQKLYYEAISIFESILDYKDAKTQIEDCQKGEIYQRALSLKQKGNLEMAIKQFTKVIDYSDAKDQIEDCKKEEIYQKAINYKEQKHYSDALVLLETILDYKDAKDQIKEIEETIAISNENNYIQAKKLKASQEYEEAIKIFEQLRNYKDSTHQVSDCIKLQEIKQKQDIYNKANILMMQESYAQAIHEFNKIEDYDDAAQLINECEFKIEEIKREKKRKARIKSLKIGIPTSIIVIIGLYFLLTIYVIPTIQLKISMKDFEYVKENDEVIITKYKGSADYVVIPEEVTKIGDSAFYECDSIVTIKISNNVTAIEKICLF